MEGDGASLRVHLQRLAINTGKVDPRLTVHWPRGGYGIWRVFNELGRQYGMAGPLPLSNLEIDAWQRLHGVRLTPWELEMIRVFDQVTLLAARKAQQ